MNVLALVVLALVQLVSLDLQPLRETIEAITTTLVDQYVEPGEGARLVCAVERADRRCFAVQRKGPAM